MYHLEDFTRGSYVHHDIIKPRLRSNFEDSWLEWIVLEMDFCSLKVYLSSYGCTNEDLTDAVNTVLSTLRMLVCYLNNFTVDLKEYKS